MKSIHTLACVILFHIICQSISAPTTLWQTPCGQVFDSKHDIRRVTINMASKFKKIRDFVEIFVNDVIPKRMDVETNPILDIDLRKIAQGFNERDWNCKRNAEVACVVSNGLRKFSYLLKATKELVVEENLFMSGPISSKLRNLLDENSHVLCDVESFMAVMNPVEFTSEICLNALKFQPIQRFDVPSHWISSSNEDHTKSTIRIIGVINEYRKFIEEVWLWTRHLISTNIQGKLKHTMCFQRFENIEENSLKQDNEQ